MHRVQKDVNAGNVSKIVGLGILLVVGLLDAGLKIFALQKLPGEQDVNLHPVLSFAVHKNPGVAFDLPIPHLIVIPLTMVIVLLFLYQTAKDWRINTKRALASVAVVIGALGNLIDRLINGFTTDYLIFFQLSAINLSDVLIVLGIAGVLWYDKRNPQSDFRIGT